MLVSPYRFSVPIAFLSFVSIVSMVSLASCGSDPAHRSLTPKKPSAEIGVKQTTVAAPRFLLARVATKDLDLESNSAVDFVTVSGEVKIANGEEAARAFASGQPAPKNRSQGLNLSTDQNMKFDLGMPAQVPVQMGDPCDPCAQSKGQIYTTSTGMTRGFFARAGGFLRRLNPFASSGEQTIPYGYSNQYSHGGNSYVVYGQQPVGQQPVGQQPMPFQPVQYQYQQPANQQQSAPGGDQPPSRLHLN